MFSNIIKYLYIGKSQLRFTLPKGHEIKPTNTFNDLNGFKMNNYLVDYKVIGNFDQENKTFEINYPHGDFALYVTGIPKFQNLDLYKLQGSLWDSYYEDDHRGYLFQVLKRNAEVLPIEIKLN